MSKFTKTIAGVVSGIALVAAAGVASADTFSRSLTVGSRGDDVTALQTWLVAKGYLVMPSGAAYGYFGNLTKAAVAAYQTAKGITPAAGYFGPVTRAAVNAEGTTGGVSTVPGCTAGAMYSSTTGQPCAGASLPAGCTSTAGYSSVTGQPCSSTTAPATGAFVADGKDGSLSVTFDPFAPSSQTLKKGDMGKAVIAVKLSATSGTVNVNRLDVEFSDRPWLFFSKITLKDDAGNVIATKALNSPADVDEITVGSDYKARFDGVNFVVSPDKDRTLIAYLDVLAASDKINNNVVYVSIPTGNIRTINGKGYTDSLGIGSGVGSGNPPSTTANAVALTLSSTGSTGTITTRVSPSSPLKRTVAVSPTNTTSDVTLGVFGLKSQNQTSRISSLTFTVQSTSSVATTTLYSNMRLFTSDGKLIAGANSLNGAATFTNLTLDLPVDQWVDVKLVADVPSGNGGQAASSSLAGGALIVGTDTNFNSVTVSSASTQSSADNVYSYSGLNVAGSAPVLSNCINGFGQNYGQTSCDMSFTLTLTAAANNVGDLFISKNAGIVLATSSSPMTASTTLTTFSNVAAIAGDTSVSYRIPTDGRTFTFQGTFSKAGGAPALQTFSINKIWFGTVGSTNGPTSTAGTNASSFIDYGLESLSVSKTL